jgi:2-(1,2-epoxy-1,2-dihydrophenyl)acetyl-CoA isomerase
MSGAVAWSQEGELAVVTIDRPQARNALGLGDMARVGQVFDEAAEAGARCVLVCGAGDFFCAGRDLHDTRPGEEDTLEIIRHVINPSLARVRECAVPTVAAVRGPALGFGFGLALACDIVLVADDALLGSPFRNLGLILDSGGHFHLRERVGRHRAAELIFTGRLFSGREAAAMGLVNRSHGALDLEREAYALARSIATGPTVAFRASKEILAEGGTFDEVADMEAVHQARLIAGADGREGVAAFQAKRKPRFMGL